MTWRATDAAAERHYADPDERRAFIAAYSDGYHGLPMWAAYESRSNCPWPNAYGAGYHTGAADRK
jgi:hypothetical protein